MLEPAILIAIGNGGQSRFLGGDAPISGSDFSKGIVAMPHAPNFAVDERVIEYGVNYFSSLLVERLGL